MAMNPCPCGYFSDPDKECRCTPLQIQRYRNKISGPLLDRIDIHVEVPSMRYEALSSMERGELSTAIRERAQAAREVQHQRYENNKKVHANTDMGATELRKYCELGADAQNLLKMAITELHFSARAYDRILKVARTIADLEGAGEIGTEHISEAIQYRSLDRELWQ